jgi:hypothetical protein
MEDELCNAYGGGHAEMHPGIWWGETKERDLGEDGRIKTSVMACRGANLPFCLTFYIFQTVKTENYIR